MGGHVGDATNVTPPWTWRNNTLEFQIMDQNFILRAQEIFRSSIVAVGLFLNVLVFSVVSMSR
jgi:5-hydroxytryptamine receptor 1